MRCIPRRGGGLVSRPASTLLLAALAKGPRARPGLSPRRKGRRSAGRSGGLPCWNGTVVYKYGASDADAWKLRPNNAVSGTRSTGRARTVTQHSISVEPKQAMKAFGSSSEAGARKRRRLFTPSSDLLRCRARRARWSAPHGARHPPRAAVRLSRYRSGPLSVRGLTNRAMSTRRPRRS